MPELLDRLKAILADRYDVERELGRGGMATVFLARDLRHTRKVAVKVLHEDLSAALGAERFRREIQIATSLTHPHILALYDSGEADGLLYYVMPFIEGESLRQRLEREKPLPIGEALKLTQEVASALDYAHNKDVVHRDIKPENILIEHKHAIVADFGIARAVSTMNSGAGALTQTGMSLGTPTYMSPEQAFADKQIDGRSDMYSLACVLYEMLVGQPPFTGPNPQAVLARHMMETVPSMQIVRATIPDELEEVVQRALAKAPADRFASVAEFSEALEECVIDYHTTTRRVDRRAVMRDTAERRAVPRYVDVPIAKPAAWKSRKVLAGAAAAALLAIGGAGWAMFGREGTVSSEAGGLDPRRVAVLYFDDVSTGRQLAHMADGLTESLIERLSQVQALDVVSPAGVSKFREGNVGIDSIASELKAGTLVRGSVEEEGDRLRVSVRLVDGNSGADVNRKTFEQPRGNVLAMRDTLAAQVADFLRERVGQEVRLRETRAGTTNVAAWTTVQRAEKLRKDAEEQVKRGDTIASRRTFATADSLLIAAERMDAAWNEPLTTRARVALSRALVAGEAIAAKPLLEQGIAATDRAIARDSRDADALGLRGMLRYRQWAFSLYTTPREATGLLAAAERDLRASVGIDPTNAEAWNQLSQVYNQKDDFTGAKLAATRAYEEDAYLANADRVLWRLYATSYDLEQFPDAVKWCEEGGRRFPENANFVRCRLWLFTTDARPPNPAEAWRDFERLKVVSSRSSWPLREREGKMLVAAALARAGQQDSARKLLLGARGDPRLDPQGSLLTYEAFVRTLFNNPADTDEAFRLLRQYLSTNPAHREGFAKSQSWWWKKLKGDNRFNDLVTGA